MWKFAARVAVGLVALAAIPVGGCGDGPTQTKSKSISSAGSSGSGSGLELMGDGEEVIGGPGAARASVGLKSPTSEGPSGAGSRRGSADGGADRASRAGQGAAAGRWSVVLSTFTQEDHAQRAAAVRAEIVRQFPELSQVVVRRLGKGSALVVGQFEGPQDAAAQAELKRVKAIERGGRKPFAACMLVRTSTDDAFGPPKPFDLRSLRAKYPKMRPLFSLQVAAWSTFGDDEIAYEDMRRAAERHCLDLRAKGHEAWFHHDEDSETSVVTVGNFDRRAYDARTTLFSPEVEELMRQFPAHLLNGEPLMVPVDPANPKGRSKPQPCRLVEVPET